MPVCPLAIFLRGDEKQEMNRKTQRQKHETKDQSMHADIKHRTRAKTPVPLAGETRIGYLPNGDKVKWVKDEDDDGQPIEWPILLRRNDNDIIKTYKECRDKVWWNLHQNQLCRIKSGEEDGKSISEEAKRAARRIERRYGRKNLGWDDDEWGLLRGRFSALAWVLGAEWDESMDV